MAVDAGDPDVRHAGRAAVQLNRGLQFDPELAFLQAGRDIRMSPGVDIRVDS